MKIIENQPLDMDGYVWRYFKTDRFLDLLRTGNLYFAAANQFDDKFEGAVAVLPPGFNVASNNFWLAGRSMEAFLPANDDHQQAFAELKMFTKISCWHRAEYESDAMWRLYAAFGKGVAIRTTPKRISEGVKPFKLKPEYEPEILYGGNVSYQDLIGEHLEFSRESNLAHRHLLERFWYKHMAFSWEKEFRVAISLRLAHEYGLNISSQGILVAFDLLTLVDRIYIGPSLSKEEIEKILQTANELGLRDRVRLSSLLGQPMFAYNNLTTIAKKEAEERVFQKRKALGGIEQDIGVDIGGNVLSYSEWLAKGQPRK